MPAACSFCASLSISFQKDKKIAKEEQSYVNFGFCSAPKEDMGRRQTRMVMDYLQQFTLSLVKSGPNRAPDWAQLLLLGWSPKLRSVYSKAPQLAPAQLNTSTSMWHCAARQLSVWKLCPCQLAVLASRWWAGMQSQHYAVLVFAWSLLTQDSLPCAAAPQSNRDAGS